MLPNDGFYHDTRAAAQRNRSRRGLIRTLRRTLTATQGGVLRSKLPTCSSVAHRSQFTGFANLRRSHRPSSVQADQQRECLTQSCPLRNKNASQETARRSGHIRLWCAYVLLRFLQATKAPTRPAMVKRVMVEGSGTARASSHMRTSSITPSNTFCAS